MPDAIVNQLSGSSIRDSVEKHILTEEKMFKIYENENILISFYDSFFQRDFLSYISVAASCNNILLQYEIEDDIFL